MNPKKLLFIGIIFFVIEIGVLFLFDAFGEHGTKEGVVVTNLGIFSLVKQDMELEDFTHVARWNLDGTSPEHYTFWSLDTDITIIMIVVDLIVIFLAVATTRMVKDIPGRLQSILEIFVSIFDNLLRESLGENSRKFVPIIGSLFIYLWVSNIIGVFPMTEEPTRNINVTLGHMVAILGVAHIESIRMKGWKHYLKSYCEPFIIMIPLNIVGEIAKGISLSFRLFGNILGGAIIIMVISYLVKYILLPAGLNLFFGLFVGTIQAFVFTMLGMTYIAVALNE